MLPRVSRAGAIVLRRDGPATGIAVTAGAEAELVLDVTLSSPGVDWSRAGAESAVVSIATDGRHVTDVLALGEQPVRRTVGLGRVAAGAHTVTMRLAGNRSPPGARQVLVSDASPRLVALDGPAGTVLRHAPVIFGRTLRTLGTPFQNATTDTPLVGWHERRPAGTRGREVLEYSVVWSGEDGGTDPSTSLARWGRTTDIEWVYRLEVDGAGRRVPGSSRFQGPHHLTLPFVGLRRHDHPLLRTRTDNNNFLPTRGGGLRFLLGFEETRPAGRAREVVMDAHPWTYRVMAGELLREGRMAARPDPGDPDVADPRSYLYVELDKQTAPAPTRDGSLGVAVEVRLRGHPSGAYRSDHGLAGRSLERDGSVTTAVELPWGSDESDVVALVAHRVENGARHVPRTVTITAVERAFLLDVDYRPRPSFVRWSGSVTLTAERPSATIWRREA